MSKRFLGILGFGIWSFCPFASSAATFTVNMSGFQFVPRDLTVNAGDTVTWVNQDFTGHDTTSGTNGVPSGLWHSPLFGNGGSFSFPFNVPAGYYGYYCTPHWATFDMVGSITVVAANVPPSVAITNPPNGAIFSAGDNIIIQASASDSDGSVARVDFSVNSNPVGSATNAPYSFTLNNVAAGNYTLSAVAVDNQGATSTPATINVSVIANVPPSVTITNPVGGQTFFAGVDVLVQASASDPDGSISKVEFFVNGVSVGIKTNPPFSVTLTGLAIGNYSLTAVATDDRGASAPSPAVLISVVPAPEPPVIIVPPQSQTVPVGSTVTFSVSASGTAPLQYQWQFNGSNLAGATTTSLVLPNVRTNDAGSYAVTVSNIAGSVTSQPATLTVVMLPHNPPVVTISSPTNGTLFVAGTNITVTADAFESNGVIAYVEFFLGTNSLGAISNAPYNVILSNLVVGDYVLGALAVDDQGLSSAAPIVSFSIIPPPSPPVITAQPQSQTVQIGSTTSFSVVATGTPPLAFQWQFNGFNLPGATNQTLVLTNVQPNDSGNYRVVITNVAGSVTSATASLLVNVPPVVAITSPTNGARFPAHADVPVTAVPSDPDGAIAKVEFFLGNNPLSTHLVGTITNQPFELVLTNLTAGDYVLTAKATDNTGQSTSSAEVRFSVHNPPSVSLIRSPSAAAVPLGTDVLLQATASGDRLNIISLALFENGTQLAQNPNGILSFIWRPSGLGDFLLTAVAIDELGQTSISIPLRVRIYIPELVRPTITITSSPPNFSRLTSPEVTLTGTASDNIALDRIVYQLNGGPLITVSSNSAWAFETNLAPGPNTLRIRSIDLANNTSFDATRFFTYVVNVPLEIDVEGSGTVTPDLNGRLLEIGKVYTITARPGPDQIFNGWGGISNALNPVLSFEMKSNLTLVAHFASNPFLTLAGTYTGLFWAMNNISVETSGFLTLQLGKAGSFSGKLSMNGNRYPFRGQFSNLTNATVPVLRRGLKPRVLGLELGPDLITGFVTNAIGTNGNVVVSKLLAQRTTAKSPVPPSQRAFVFQQAGDDSTAPSGNASARINKAGSVQIRGRLSDARKFTLVTGLAQDGSSPFYISPGWGTEAIIGWLLFGEDATSVSGTLFWIKLGSDPIALEVSAGLP